MQTVNFQCGHCGNLMAVGTDFLGQQVRCPHCQQVVLAPALTPDQGAGPPPGPADRPFDTTARSNNDDIFAPANEAEDDLFGREAPRLELPRHPAPGLGFPGEGPAAPPPAPDWPTTPAPHLAPAGGSASLQAGTAPTPDLPPDGGWPPPAGAPGPEGLAFHGGPPAAGAGAAESGLPAPRGVRKPSSGGAWFIPMVFLPVVFWAISATGIAIWMAFEATRKEPSIFERMPDVDGDNPGVRKEKKGVTLKFDKRKATAPLPAHLVVGLEQPLRIGALEVTPLRVERKKVKVFVEGFRGNPEPCPYDSLVLHLRLRNLAADYSFTPLDNYFDRHWNGQGSPPLTLLEAGTAHFFGGPAKWFQLNRPKSDRNRREWVEGRLNVDPDGLKPGQEKETLVCTDGADEQTALYLFGTDADGKQVRKPYSGPLLWRVHVRRGLIDYKKRRLPAAAVVGVEFTDKDYQKAG